MRNLLKRGKKKDGKDKKKEKEAADTGVDDPFAKSGAQELQKPADQLDLTEAEKKKEHTRILTAQNPHAPDNIVRFCFKDSEFKQTAQVEQLAVHFSLNGNLIHKEGDEARRQIKREEMAQNAANRATKSAAVGDSDSGSDSDEDGEEKTTNTASAGTGGETKKVLRNQFNFSERAAQTFNNPYRHREEQTEPPPRADFSGTVNQWRIFDAYEQDIARQEKEKEKANKKGGRHHTEDRSAVLAKKRAALELEKQAHGGDDLRKIEHAAKIVERMVLQNIFNDFADDFKYFDDESDNFKDGGKGTLLPLWRFNSEATSKLAVTSVNWFDHYTDLMAVGYGSFNFAKQSGGALLIYSLKNPKFPENIYETSSGVMTVDIHPTQRHYVCCGLYNGDVAVYNLKSKSTKPEFISTTSENADPIISKHTDPVWQVKWQPDNLDSLMNFCSISSDGKIGNWVLVKNELMYKTVVTLKNIDTIDQLDDPRCNFSLASGTAFAFHPNDNNLFLAGTEEGKVFKSFQSYTSRYLDIIPAHNMTIETIVWSPFHDNVFMTCSQDWTLKIWDHKSSNQPLFVFELGHAVGSCCWSYHSSTVFAAVTTDGKAHVFDLSVNKYEALACQTVAQKRKTKLTSIAFNKRSGLPILLVGDDRGYVSTFKLSPNLRKIPKQKKGVVYKLDPEVERQKLDKIVELVRT